MRQGASLRKVNVENLESWNSKHAIRGECSQFVLACADRLVASGDAPHRLTVVVTETMLGNRLASVETRLAMDSTGANGPRR